MKHKHGSYMNISQGPVWIVFVILSLILLSQVLGGNKVSQLVKQSKVPITEAHKRRIARKIAADYGLGPFQPSLDMKESADFMLTPALLMQEALSDDIVMTYPTE